MMWRHGDVMIAAVEAIPDGTKTSQSAVLAWGEITGHSHRIEDPGTAEIVTLGDRTFLRVTAAQARIVHEEHKPITLPRGTYRFWFQREYSPQAIRRVID